MTAILHRRRALLRGVASWLALPLVARAIDAPAIDVVRLVKVAPGLWRVPAAEGEADAGNGGLVVQLVIAVDPAAPARPGSTSPEGRGAAPCWLVGSGPTPPFGERLAAALREAGLPLVTDVVNTRPQPELALANTAFGAARLWSLRSVGERMNVQCPSCLDRLKAALGAGAGASLDASAIRVPDTFVDAEGAASGRLGPFEWWPVERAPGQPVLVLRHRTSRTIVAQGLLWAGAVPLLRDTDSALMLQAWRGLLKRAGGAALIGEQGEPAHGAALRAHIAYVEALHRAVVQRMARGETEAGASAGVQLPAFAALPGYAARHPLNVQRVWRELEAGWLR